MREGFLDSSERGEKDSEEEGSAAERELGREERTYEENLVLPKSIFTAGTLDEADPVLEADNDDPPPSSGKSSARGVLLLLPCCRLRPLSASGEEESSMLAMALLRA